MLGSQLSEWGVTSIIDSLMFYLIAVDISGDVLFEDNVGVAHGNVKLIMSVTR